MTQGTDWKQIRYESDITGKTGIPWVKIVLYSLTNTNVLMKNADCVKGKRSKAIKQSTGSCLHVMGMSGKKHYMELDRGKKVRLWFDCSLTTKSKGPKKIGHSRRLWTLHYSTAWSLDEGRQGRSSNGGSLQSQTIPSSCWTLSGKPDIVFLRLTFLGRRARVSVFIRERRTLAWRSNVCPGDQVRRAGVESRQAVSDEHAFFPCRVYTYA